MNLDKLSISKKHALRIVFTTAVILLVPLIAMQFTNEVLWHFGDFVVAAILLLSFAYIYVILANQSNSSVKKAIIGLVVFVLFALVWAIIAVDLI